MAPSGPRRYTPQSQRTKKPTFCYQCVAGPDLLTVEEEDGVAVRVESNYGAADKHPGGGRVASRPMAWCRRRTIPIASNRR